MIQGFALPRNTDSLYKNLNNNPDLYEMLHNIVFNGEKVRFNPGVSLVGLSSMYGFIRNEDGFCEIHNRIFEKKIYDKMLVDHMLKNSQTSRHNYELDAGGLDMKKTLIKFQTFMRENHSSKDDSFLEREGRLLFSAFLKPIINGKGFDFKEPIVGEERRADIVVTYEQYKYLIELKIWYGEKYIKKD